MPADAFTMQRRRMLALLSASLAGLAGCTSGDDPGTEPGAATGTQPDATTSPASATAGTPHGDPTRTPGSDPGEEPGLPVNPDDVDRVVWHDDVTDPDGRVVLEPAVESASLPDATLEFTLTNGSDRKVATNFYSWAVYRKEGGRWHHVAPRYVNQPLMHLPSGDTHTWHLTADSDVPAGTPPAASGTEDVAVAPLGGGTYAFTIDGWFPDQTATPTYEHETVWAARFRLDGPDLALEPSDRVTGHDRVGGTVEVDARGFDPREESRAATYVLSRTPDATAARELVTEQAYRYWPLRDALAFADDDVDEIRVRSYTGTHPPYGLQDDQPAVRYEGSTWTASVEDVAGDE
jgi:hypothetical protein